MKFTLFNNLLVVALLCGCSKESPKPGVDPKAFDAAPPEIKQVWDQAMTASASNDLVSAIMILRMLGRQQISQEQAKAACQAQVFYVAKLKEDAKRGDPAAIEALETLGLGSAKPGR